MRDVVIVDTETDGLHPERQVWEFAAVRIKPDGTEISRFKAMVPITLNKFSDPMALQIGKFYQRYEYPAYPLANREISTKIAHITQGALWAGIVPSFDVEVVQRYLTGHGLALAHHYKLMDVLTAAQGALTTYGKDGAPSVLQMTTEAVCEAYGVQVDPDKRHTAMGDVEMTLALYRALV